ncbi:hypothetical protein GCM10009579_85310 [Streptomyces javensis]|uniref:Uncharacterized protein n=1 Tax=Streptomyces javensis TaxID=114698 RepID=A0ABP4I4X1_9ACTN
MPPPGPSNAGSTSTSTYTTPPERSSAGRRRTVVRDQPVAVASDRNPARPSSASASSNALSSVDSSTGPVTRFAADGDSCTHCSAVSGPFFVSGLSFPPKNGCSTRCALTPVTRGVRGRRDSTVDSAAGVSVTA